MATSSKTSSFPMNCVKIREQKKASNAIVLQESVHVKKLNSRVKLSVCLIM
jgi:hypothetical protein